MLGIDRSAARGAWTIGLVGLLFYLIYLVRATFFVFVLAVLFAYLLTPLVDLLNRFLPTGTRTPALALAYVIFVGAAVFGGIEIGTRVFDQTKLLAHQLPGDVEKWRQAKLDAPTTLGAYEVQLVDKDQLEISKRANDLISTLPQAGAQFLSVASRLIYLVIIPVLAFFFLKDGHVIRRHLLDALEEGPRRVLLDDVLADMDALMAHYIRALVALSLAAFTVCSIFFAVVGMPYGLLLAAFAAPLEVVPILGPAVAGVTIVLVALISGTHPLAVVIFVIAFRMLQDYILSPHLMGRGVELHPLLVLFGVFAGAEVAGVAGTFLSVPTLALARVLYLRLRKAQAAAHLGPTTTATPSGIGLSQP
jgi:predicted PurR-regulated permease PerM